MVNVNPYQQQNQNPIPYGAVKDVVPQSVSQKLPPNVQNYDKDQFTQSAQAATEDTIAGTVAQSLDMDGMKPWQIALSAIGSIVFVFGVSALMNGRGINKGKLFAATKNIDNFANMVKNTKGYKKIADVFSKPMGNFKAWFKKTKLGDLFSDKKNLLAPRNAMASMSTGGTKTENCDEICDALEAVFGGKVKNDKSSLTNRALNKIRKTFKRPEVNIERFDLDKFLSDAGATDIEKADFKKAFDKYASSSKMRSDKEDLAAEFVKLMDRKLGFEGMSGAELRDALSKNNGKLGQKVNLMGLPHEIDLIDTYKKYKALNGHSAETGLGRLFQKGTIKITEAPTNGVTSRAKLGLGMGIYFLMSAFNRIIKAKKEDKVATAADALTGDLGGYMMMPVAGGALYGLASLKYLGFDSKNLAKYKADVADLNKQFANATSQIQKQKILKQFKELKKTTFKNNGGFFSKLIRTPAKVLSMGLEDLPSKNALTKKLKGFSGGALRFVAFLFVISPLLQKPIQAVSQKIFGKTEEMKQAEAEKKAEKERKKEAKNNPQPTPDIQMTEEELVKKLEANPQIVAQLQNNPQLMEQVANNPQILIDMLNQTGETPNATTPNINGCSPALNEYINANTQVQPNSQVVQPLNNQPTQPTPSVQQNPTATQTTDPVRTYVPSSSPVQISGAEAEQASSIQTALDKADKLEAQAMDALNGI